MSCGVEVIDVRVLTQVGEIHSFGELARHAHHLRQVARSIVGSRNSEVRAKIEPTDLRIVGPDIAALQHIPDAEIPTLLIDLKPPLIRLSGCRMGRVVPSRLL